MAISPYKTYSAGEILTAADLNASFSHITSNGEDLGWPATKNKDLDSFLLVLDADGDSSFGATNDDVAVLKLQNVSCFTFDGDAASIVNGLTFTASATGTAVALAATGGDTNIDLQVGGKGTGDVVLTSGLVRKTGSDVASASALAVDIAGDVFDVTGTTTVTSINSKGVGAHITLQFDGALTLTHHATNLILPGGANITTAAGDMAVFVEYGSGTWRCVTYQRAKELPNRRAQFYSGSYTGDGATSKAITGLPFAPLYVKIAERATADGTNIDVFETWAEVMDDNASGGAIKHAGASGHSFQANQIIALGASSFTVDDDGSDSHPNQNGTVYNYFIIG